MSKQNSPLRLFLWLAVALALGASLLWLVRPQAEGRVVASITVGEETVRTIDLTKARIRSSLFWRRRGSPLPSRSKTTPSASWNPTARIRCASTPAS